MIVVVALAFTVACVVASFRRLGYVVEATPFDPARLATSMRGARGALHRRALPSLGALLVAVPGADWEREMVEALIHSSVVRSALLGEAMTELDFLARRWSRVPRVAASLASSFGFLLATIALRIGLSDLSGPLNDAQVFSVNSAVLDAIDVAAVGLVGAAFCVAIHYRARGAYALRVAGADRLVEFLEGVAEGDGGALVCVVPRATVDSAQGVDVESHLRA